MPLSKEKRGKELRRELRRNSYKQEKSQEELDP